MEKWFIQENNQIKGPFDLAKLENYIKSSSADLLIWGKGMTEWLPPSEWREHYTILKSLTQEETLVDTMWFYKNNDFESSLLPFEKLIDEIQQIKNKEHLFLKSDKKSKWQSIFATPTVADRLGITRRNTFRVPILGYLTGQKDLDHQNIKAKVITISEGGCGITESSGLNLGETFKGIIKSPHLNSEIHFHGEVVFQGNNGYEGIKYTSIASEAKSQIIEYINRFREET